MTENVQPTAAVVVIGDEVLSGKVDEQNAAFMIRRFRSLGVSLKRVVIVPDEMEDIGEAVRSASERFDIVCTTGGVGPTHDDITIEAIAQAFGVSTVSHPRLEALVREYFGADASEAQLRLALVPDGTTLDGGDGPPWPTARFRNVVIFPGIPRLMASKFDAIAHTFGGAPMYAGSLEV
ncbi:MAG: competence/damage-inducible protein A, partial [Myxococcota bacterium]|nr:competence/damage-inducible protein A [Myxococcota bacterium]